MEELIKPPLGLTPKHISKDIARGIRINEIQGATKRYFTSLYPIPLEWIKEYNQLIKEKDESKNTQKHSKGL